MVAQLEKTEKGYVIQLSEQMVEELGLRVGAPVDLRPVESATDTRSQIEYISADEAMRIHRKLEPRFAAAYRELAK